MARSLTPRDAHALMNLLVAEATGQDDEIQVVDSSTFVSAGETVLSTGKENVYNALSVLMGRRFAAVRPYEAKMMLFQAINSGMYTNRLAKISYYARKALPSGDFNTNLYTNLANGYDNGSNDGTSTASMWVQNQAMPLEMNFAGTSVWQDSTTIYDYQEKGAFRDESSFNEFISGIMTEKGNDIESQKEAFNRMALLNYIAGIYDMNSLMNGSVVNLTEEYNTKFGTSYTSAQLRTTYLSDFLKFFVAEVKLYSDKMTNRSERFHWSVPQTVDEEEYVILRHTPKSKQKLMLYKPLFVDAEAYVMPEIFNPQYLSVDNYEGVMFWQNELDPSAISVTPAIPDSSTGVQTAGDAVALSYVVGTLFDTDALVTDFQLETSAVTPLEARKHYRNMWWSFARNAINDFTENGIIFIMAD